MRCCGRRGRWSRPPQGPVVLGDPPQRALLRVVVEVGLDPPEVVTVYATTQFRRYGAKP
jgi:hypothetical protein